MAPPSKAASPAPRRPNPLKDRPPIKAPPPIVRQKTPAKKPRQRTCPNKACNSVQIEDGICTDCGFIIEEVNIVAEVSFGETSSGAAMVQGTYISADQGGAASGGIGGRGGDHNQRQKTLTEGKERMNQLQNQLNIGQTAVEAGHQIFKLAANANFIQGRRIDMVAVVCLYSACRKSRPCRVMLIDFADKIQVNVFKLGATFKALHKAIPISADGIMPILPEDLIHRFSQKLEFGDLCDKVAEDAVRMVKRMSLDWMVMGRRPSGVCGACLILAARMNNFRRTITEVVYIVKVTTHTIQKRLEEFKLTPSSALTVEEFLHNEFLESSHDPPSFYEKTEDFQKTKKKRKRKPLVNHDDGSESDDDSPNKRQKTATPGPDQQIELRRDADGFAIPPLPNQVRNPSPPSDPDDYIDPSLRALDAALSQVPSNNSSTPQPETGDNVPQVTADTPRQLTPLASQSTQAAPPVNEAGEVPNQAQANITPPPTQTSPDLGTLGRDAVLPEVPEDILDGQTESTFEKLVAAFGDVDGVGSVDVDDTENPDDEVEEPRRKRGPDNRPIQVDEAWDSAEQELETEINEIINDPNTIDHAQSYAIAKERAAVHMLIAAQNNPPKEVSMDVHIGEDEFKDDPEVMNCLLSPEDVADKEKLWVNENKHWLRKQQIREWERRAAENGPPKAKRNRKKKPRMGENQTSAASSPAEAANEALKRHTFSKKVNYDAINLLFDTSDGIGNLGSAATSRVTSQAGSDLGSEAGSRASSLAPSEASGAPNPLDVFDAPAYLRKRSTAVPKPRTARSTPRASPAPSLRALAPRPSAEPEGSVRSTPALEDEEEDVNNPFDHVDLEDTPAPARGREDTVEDWRAALKKARKEGRAPRAEGEEEEEEEEEADVGLEDFDDEEMDEGDGDDGEEGGGFVVDEDLADYQ